MRWPSSRRSSADAAASSCSPIAPAARWSELTADEVNAYIAAARRRARSPPKTFAPGTRPCWRLSALAARARQTGAKATRARRDREVAAAIKTVAAYLGNTPAVCRASYVDPRVIDRYHAGATIAPALGRLVDGRNGDAPDLSRPRVRRRVETAVLDLLDDC